MITPLPNYDNWLERPYMENQWSHDDYPEYNEFVQEWLKDKVEQWRIYVEDMEGEPDILSFDDWFGDEGSVPQSLEDFYWELNEARQMEAEEAKAEMIKDGY